MLRRRDCRAALAMTAGGRSYDKRGARATDDALGRNEVLLRTSTGGNTAGAVAIGNLAAIIVAN